MRILIAGTGFAGGVSGISLAEAGHEVWGLNRGGKRFAGVRSVRGDVLAVDGLRALEGVPPVDVMISALSGAGYRDPGAYRAMYVDGPRRVADALRWRGRRRIWFLGSTGVYGESAGEWVDEATPVSPLHAAGGVQVEAEAALRAAAEEVCVLRLSGLYGAGRTRLIRQALRKRPYLKPEVWANQIHREDVAGTLRFLAGRREAPPPVLLVSDDLPLRRREIFDWVRKELKCPEGWIDEDPPDRATRNRGNKRVSNRLLRELGVELRYADVRAGLAPELGRMMLGGGGGGNFCGGIVPGF